MDMSGNVGPHPVGATLWVWNHDNIVTGHYFYSNRLADIALTPLTQNAPTLDLSEPGGGVFHLHFTGNGSNGGAPLNFSNAIALDGTWTQGARSLPVHLGFAGSLPGSPTDRRYADVTQEPDQALEARVQQFKAAVLAGDRKAVVRHIAFPLRSTARPASTSLRAPR